MEQNSEKESAQEIRHTRGFEYIGDAEPIYSGIPRYWCLNCGVGVARERQELHTMYHEKRGDYDD